MSKVDWINGQITSNKVVIFSKSYCPFCKMAKKAFQDVGFKDYVVFELNEMDDGDEIQASLKEITGERTVPQVFIGGKFIGGGSETKAFQESGELVTKLKSAGAL